MFYGLLYGAAIIITDSVTSPVTSGVIERRQKATVVVPSIELDVNTQNPNFVIVLQINIKVTVLDEYTFI